MDTLEEEKKIKNGTLNIISIHEDIVREFEENKKQMESIRNQIEILRENMTRDNLTNRTLSKLKEAEESLIKKIKQQSNEESYNFYMFDSISLINEYKAILEKPIKISFIKKNTLSSDNIVKMVLVKKYINVLYKYGLRPDISISEDAKIDLICKECDSINFDEDGSIYTCIDCGVQVTIVSVISCFKDIDRINITNKYTYDRRVHFRECMNQFQSKPNQIIPDEVFNDLQSILVKHGLTESDKIKREHIHVFLKELGYVKYYDDISYIYHTITGKKPIDISNLEDKLMEDFNKLTAEYDKKYRDDSSYKRKNFINIQCVLFQLLRKHKFPCRFQDFNTLKTIDRKTKHEDIISDLFYSLGWNYTSIF